MSNVLQLSVKLLVCGCYGVFQTLRAAIRITSLWREWFGDRNLLGNVKISPWKCGYRLGLKVAIVLISKTVLLGGNQALGRLSGIKVTVLYKTGINYLFVLMKVKVVVFQLLSAIPDSNLLEIDLAIYLLPRKFQEFTLWLNQNKFQNFEKKARGWVVLV